MLFNVWHKSQHSKTTLLAINDIAARQEFARRWGWLSDQDGYWNFVHTLYTEKVY